MITNDVLGTAFQHLLRARTPLAPDRIAIDLQLSAGQVRSALGTLGEQGLLRLAADGSVIGAAGLSIEPDRHQIDLDGHRYWTWCAYDILGIFAALGASGTAVSAIPDSADNVELVFRDGRPQRSDLVLFVPDDDLDCCGDAYEEWCPKSNLFQTAADAAAWATRHAVKGSALTLAEGSARGGDHWRPLAEHTTPAGRDQPRDPHPTGSAGPRSRD